MSTQIFLQRFSHGQPAAVPYKPLTAHLARYGVLVDADGDLQLKFLQQDVISQSGIEGRVLVVGDPESGVHCLAIENPRTLEPAARFLFELMKLFDLALFDDQLSTIYLKQGSRCELPDAMLAACASGVRRVGHPLQIWPEALRLPSRFADRALLLPYTEADGGRHYQRIDDIADESKVFRYFLDLHPAACTAPVARATRHLLARLERVVLEHRPSRLEVMFNHHDSFLPVIEAPKVGASVAPLVTVTPPPPAFGMGETLNPPLIFRAALNADSTARYNSQECRLWAEQTWGLSLDGSAASVERLDSALQALRGQQPAAPAQQAAEWVARGCWQIGSYWGELLRREIGAQWGYVEWFNGRYAALRCYRGRTLFPLLDIAERLFDQDLPPLAAQLAELRAELRSASLDQLDFVGDIPMHIATLIGRVLVGFDQVPLQSRLPVAELDHSLDSLRSLDRWLRQVGAQRRQFSDAQMIGVMHAAAAYLGEVMREQLPGEWHWENYHDYFDGTPGLPDVDFQPTTAAVFLGHGRLLFPIASVGERITGEEPSDLYDWVVRTYSEIEPGWSPPAAVPLGSDEESSARARLDPATLAADCARLQRICADTDYQLDGSVESVTEVDRFVDAIRAKQRGRLDAMAVEVLSMLAGYVGERLVQAFGAQWRPIAGSWREGRSEASWVLQTRYGCVLDPLSVLFARARSQQAQRIESMCMGVKNEFDLRTHYPAPVVAAQHPAGSTSPSAAVDPAKLAAAMAAAQVTLAQRSAEVSARQRSQLRIAVLVGPLAGMAIGSAAGWVAGLLTLLAISGGSWLWARAER
jgi:hypothetical protein